MKKVLLVTTRDFKHLGGIERYLDNLILHYEKDQYELVILCPETAKDHIRQNPKIAYVYYQFSMQPIKNFFRFLNPLFMVKNFRGILDQKIQAIKPDLIFTRDLDAAYVCALVFYPIYFFPGSLLKLDLYYDYAFEGSLLYRLSRKIQTSIKVFMEKRAFQMCSRVYVFSHAFKFRIIGYYKVNPRKIRVIPIGFNLPGLNPKEKNKVKPKTILMVGRLSRSKNIDLALEALDFLPDYTLWLVGEGQEREAIEDRIDQAGLSYRVKLFGQQEEVATYYRECDVFLHLSYYENFGQVLLEAMAYGKPPIVLQPDEKEVLTASQEIIRDGQNGFFCGE